ncbi:helix-turn-helix transcriptional regulator [Dysosmobacter sp.]
MDIIVSRILQRLEDEHLDQKTFASEIGVSPTTITDWKTGKSASYMKKINIICAALATPVEWMMFGSGPKTNLEKAKKDGSLERAERLANGENVLQPNYANGDDIKAAFFEGGEDLSQEEMDELWADAKDYIQYKLSQRRKKQDGQ